MSLTNNIQLILTELEENSKKLSDDQARLVLKDILKAKHIFLAGAGRSGLAVKGFANRLLHLGFDVSVVGEISSPHSHEGDLVIICSGSGETASLKGLAEKAKTGGLAISLIPMAENSSIGNLADSKIILPGRIKTDSEDAQSIQPMGSAFEQMAFLLFDALVLDLMTELQETSETMFARHADFE